MGRLKQFLINEQMKITGNWREKDHYEYLTWKKGLPKEKKVYNEGKTKVSRRKK